ncbi:MAG: phosphoenolpyruvate--protein phosphotransferase [Micromonosporaceae bacterium]|nr:phosphoenolpyruvate--protein phosphotransferase [Micromonosporaceae bacterium]
MADRIELPGFGIGTRAVAGPVTRMAGPLPEPPPVASDRTPDAELAAARAALAAVAGQLRARAATLAGGTEAAEVLEAQAMMALDPALGAAVERAVAAGRTAARAIHEAFDGYLAALAAAGGRLAARVADLADVRQRAIAASLQVPVPSVPDPGHPYILVAHDLAPADTAVLDLGRVLGFVTAGGGPTSHTAVLARSRGIPAVVGCTGAERLTDGVTALVDPARSLVIGAPDPIEFPAELPAATSDGARTAASAAFAGPGRTADGHPVALLANLGDPAEAVAAAAAGAEGVGLLRTELLFLDAPAAPSWQRQRDAYRTVLAAFAGRRVVVRVLDAGADKPLPYLTGPPEPNPALGRRGVRALRAAPHLLRPQLAAIAAAAATEDAEVWVMAPMVAEPDEAAWFTAEAAAQGLLTAGVMIEVPSAVVLAEEILAVTDFVSIGTNDLAQYALAADRQLGGLGALQDPWHPAVLRLVRLVGEAGARAGKPVGVCGEAAADPLLACVLVGLGAGSLSMAPAALAPVRAALAGRTLAQCRALADQVTAAGSAAAARVAGLP